MAATYEDVGTPPDASWQQYRRAEERFGFAWHFHPEFELTLITRGVGTRFVGDSVAEYRPGDLTLIGPGMPHTYVSAPGEPAEAIVSQFRRDFLGAELFDRPEMAAVARLLERSSRGLSFPDVDDAHLRRLALFDDMSPPERVLDLLTVLVALAEPGAGEPLSSMHYRPRLREEVKTRIDAACQFLHDNYTRRVSLAEVAAVAHLTPPAFSRFFRRTTGRTVTAYLAELRIATACRLLANTDLPITDVASRCGFQNLSNFNRHFRQARQMAPREYRCSVWSASADSASG